jgi:hypothetical protein
MTLSKTRLLVLCMAAAGILASGCATARTNITYDSSKGDVARLEKPVRGAIVSVVDAREKTRTYPKQVIEHTDYSGNVTHDINDRTVEEVFTDALTDELRREGVSLVRLAEPVGTLDRESADSVRKLLAEKYPDIQVAFGAKIIEFMADSRRTLVANKAHVSGWMQLYVLDMKTGDLLWSDYKTEWDDTLLSADRDKMIEELDQALSDLMHKSIRNNMSLRDLLVRNSGR